jgi:membrane-bound ClpP family serine protease
MGEQPSTARVALKWGAFLGVTLMVITLVMYLTDQTANPLFSVLTLGSMVAFLILSMRDFRSLNGGYMSYGEGLGVGTLVSAIGGLLSAAFITFYNVVIDPTVQQRALEAAREKMEEQGKLTDEQIDQALEFSQKFQSPGFTFIAGVLGTIIMGFLLSLIVAAFIRRNKANPFE